MKKAVFAGALALSALFASTALADTCVGTCGTSGANGVVTASPLGGDYQYISTNLGVTDGGTLAGTSSGSTNGSLFTTSAFSAAAGDDLEFYFNFVTSDGSGYADYAWVQLLTSGGTVVDTLFTARTLPSGTIVPGTDLPPVTATLNPASVPIISGGPAWAPLGGDSGACWDAGCGYTGWIQSKYTVASAGNYILKFGVSNWDDEDYDTGLAFDGITIGGEPIPSGVPEPATWAMMIIGFGAAGSALRARRSRAALAV